jgi:hypothetical protein
MKNTIKYTSAFVLTAFGLLTLFMSTSVIFDLFGIREKEGNYVLFVVWANFICGILYLIGAFGFMKDKKWLPNVMIAASVLLIVTFGGLFLHIQNGGIYEVKTVGAMTFRTLFTVLFTASAFWLISKNKS